MSLLTTADTASNLGVDSSSTSTDNHLVRWDGVTGELVQDNGVVTVSDGGIMLGVTSFTVDNILINGNTIEALGTNQSLTLQSTGTGTVTINGVVIDASKNLDLVNHIDMDGNLTMYSGNILVDAGNIDLSSGQIDVTNASSSVPTYQAIGTNAAPGLRVKQGADNQSTIIDFYEKLSTRKGWFGFGSSGFLKRMTWSNDYSGGTMFIVPDNNGTNGVLTIEGFTQLGGTGSPKIKMKAISGQTSSSSSGNITIAHGLTGADIMGMQGIVRTSTNAGIPPSYEGAAGYDWDFWYDATNVHILNSGSSITSKTVDILITYKA